MEATKFLGDVQDSFKKFSLLLGQVEMVFVVVWFLDHFTLKSVPSVNGVWIIAFVSHHHVWITKFKPSLMFFKLSVLISNNVVWVPFPAILFDESQHVVKASMTGYVPLCYEVINLLFFFFQGLSMLFIEPQNLLLMGLAFFFICKLKGLDTTCKIFNFHGMQCFLNAFAFGRWLPKTSSYIPSSLI